MKRPFGFVVVLVGVAVGSGTALAGGWAVSSLDSVPTPQAGVPVGVGFVIRQHGVTPVNPDGDVGISVRSTEGVVTFFAAEPAGQVGHFVAQVTFPEPGVFGWAVRQGWFADQDLGSIDVGESGIGGAVGGQYRWPGWARVGLPILAVGFATIALGDLWSGRRVRVAV